MKFYMCVFCAIVCMISLLGLDFFFYPEMFRTNHPKGFSSEACLFSVVCYGIKTCTRTHTCFSEHVPILENISIIFPSISFNV